MRNSATNYSFHPTKPISGSISSIIGISDSISANFTIFNETITQSQKVDVVWLTLKLDDVNF